MFPSLNSHFSTTSYLLVLIKKFNEKFNFHLPKVGVNLQIWQKLYIGPTPPTQQTVCNSHKRRFRSESPNLKMSCHPSGDWHPGWEKNRTPRHLQPAKDPSQRTTRPPWGGTRVPIGWMVQGRWWWSPEGWFLPIKNNGCFFGPSSARFGSWSLSLFHFFEVIFHDFSKGQAIGDDLTHTKNLLVCFLKAQNKSSQSIQSKPKLAQKTAINIGKLQTNSTSLPPYQVLVIFKLLPSSFEESKFYLPTSQRISNPIPHLW